MTGDAGERFEAAAKQLEIAADLIEDLQPIQAADANADAAKWRRRADQLDGGGSDE